jgi:hypothetical protein
MVAKSETTRPLSGSWKLAVMMAPSAVSRMPFSVLIGATTELRPVALRKMPVSRPVSTRVKVSTSAVELSAMLTVMVSAEVALVF